MTAFMNALKALFNAPLYASPNYQPFRRGTPSRGSAHPRQKPKGAARARRSKIKAQRLARRVNRAK